MELITDRTQTDVNHASTNRDSLLPLKGAYNAEDYNRVGKALNYLSDWLHELGYGFNPKLRENWKVIENFTPNDGAKYLEKIRQLRESFFVFPETPQLPEHIHDLFGLMGITWANNIEKLLLDIENLIKLMISAFFYSDEIYSGEV